VARLRSSFRFAVNDLFVTTKLLGAVVEFTRGGYGVSVRFTGGGTLWSGVTGNPKQTVNVSVVQVSVSGEAPPSTKDFADPFSAGSDERAREACLALVFHTAHAVGYILSPFGLRPRVFQLSCPAPSVTILRRVPCRAALL
jgi:hypothetical protein